MAIIKDFKIKHSEKIFTIDPGVSSQNGTGWAIGHAKASTFGGTKNLPFLQCTGIVTPFSSVPLMPAIMELGDKIIEIWRQNEGFSNNPLAVVIELPMFFTNSFVNPNSIRDLTLFTGSLLRALKPKNLYLPSAPEWKGRQKKEDTKFLVNSNLDFHSDRALRRDLAGYPTYKQHNIYDAIGLLLYGGQILKGIKQPPKHFYKAA